MQPNRYLRFKHLMDGETFAKWVMNNCRVIGGECAKQWHGCKVGKTLIIYAPTSVSVPKRIGKEVYYTNYVNGALVYVFNLPKTYINLGRVKITWLGGRQMRGVMLPPSVKVLFFMTNGKCIEESEADVVGGVEKYRLSDLLQAIFRINSREDVVVVMDILTKRLLRLVLKIYEWHIYQLVHS